MLSDDEESSEEDTTGSVSGDSTVSNSEEEEEEKDVGDGDGDGDNAKENDDDGFSGCNIRALSPLRYVVGKSSSSDPPTAA